MAKLTINRPNRPADEVFEIHPYGLFRNGYTYEVEPMEKDTVIGVATDDLPSHPWPTGIESLDVAHEIQADEPPAEPIGVQIEDDDTPVSPEGEDTGPVVADDDEEEI